MRRLARLVLALSIGLSLPRVASAQGAGMAEPGAVLQDGWRISLGAGIGLRPDYEGSRSLVAMALPQFDIRYRDSLFATSAGGAPALGVNLLGEGAWRAGPLMRLRFPRYQNANAALAGLGNVGWVPELGGFLEYRAGVLRLGAEVRRGVGDHDGVIAELRADAVLRPASGLVVSFGPRLNLGDESFVRRYFGVDPTQSANSGYAPYRPGGGVTSVGASLFASYAITSNLSVTGFAAYSRLQAGAADSPIVRGRGDPNQFFTALSLSYAFSW